MIMAKIIRNILGIFIRKTKTKEFNYIDIYKQTILNSSYFKLKTNYKDFVKNNVSPKPVKIKINIKSKCLYN